MRSIDEILRTYLGPACQEGITDELAAENRFRVGDLWAGFPEALRGAGPPAVSTVKTVRAFPHTRVTGGGVHLIVDQHLIELLSNLTWHLVADTKPRRVLVEGQRIMAERLLAAGHPLEAVHLLQYARIRDHEEDPVPDLSRPSWEQGDLLARGQWMFTLAHEMVHTMLASDDLAAEMRAAVEERVQEALEQLAIARTVLTVAAAKGQGVNDDARLWPVLYVAHLIQAGGVDDFEALPIAELVQGQLIMVQTQLDEELRDEIVCDFFAALAVCKTLERFTVGAVAAASCLMALSTLTMIQRFDDAARSDQPALARERYKAATRLLLLRGAILAAPCDLFPSDDDLLLASRAMGDLMTAFGETYEILFRCDWVGLLQGLRAAIAE